MLKRLRLRGFKNFEDAELQLGPLTVLVGTNASGKSNIRDAFKFLHGISRGYSLAEIFGEKWIEGGVLQWRGIRGGVREVAFTGEDSFLLEIAFGVNGQGEEREAEYSIEIEVASRFGPRVRSEWLRIGERIVFLHKAEEADLMDADVGVDCSAKLHLARVVSSRPILSQIIDHPDVSPEVVRDARLAMAALASMRFLDLAPDAMRLPSFPGQTILGDRGENLSSVLQAICEDPAKKTALVDWVKELTPLDAIDFEFFTDAVGKISLMLVEDGGRKTSIYSASDGTLRFLAMIAALLGPEPARFYFFEELENGIHPTRLHLLLQLIEQKVGECAIQMVATSHSPQLLGQLNSTSLQSASLVYRLPGRPSANIRRIVDIPQAVRVLEKQELTTLHASGWLEDAAAFSEAAE